MGKLYITREGYEKLRTELDELRKLKVELSEQIGEAMAQGDLRENAGYAAAKERQAETLRRMGEIQIKLSSAELTDSMEINRSEARLGAKVLIKDVDSGEETAYSLVVPDEADFSSGKISIDSPLAQGILGRKEGEKFTVSLPRGDKKLILKKLEY